MKRSVFLCSDNDLWEIYMPLNPVHLLIVPVQSKIYSIVINTPPFYNEA